MSELLYEVADQVARTTKIEGEFLNTRAETREVKYRMGSHRQTCTQIP